MKWMKIKEMSLINEIEKQSIIYNRYIELLHKNIFLIIVYFILINLLRIITLIEKMSTAIQIFQMK